MKIQRSHVALFVIFFVVEACGTFVILSRSVRFNAASVALALLLSAVMAAITTVLLVKFYPAGASEGKQR